MEYRPQEIKAGIMVIICTVIFIVFLFLISGINIHKSTNQYIARFKYINGLEVGSVVRYGGMEVGSVKDLYIYDKNNSLIEFVLEVDKDIPIKTNSQAIVTSIGLMGEYHINISTGHPDSALLVSGGVLKCKEVPSLSQLMEPIGEIADQMKAALSEIENLFGTQNQEEIRSIFLNLNKLLAENHKTISTLMTNMNNAIVDLNQLTDKVDNLLIANESNISNSVKHLEGTLQQTKKLMKSFDRMIVDLDNALLTKGTNFNEIIDNLKRTTNNLEEFSRSIKDRPWQLIRKSAPSERKTEY